MTYPCFIYISKKHHFQYRTSWWSRRPGDEHFIDLLYEPITVLNAASPQSHTLTGSAKIITDIFNHRKYIYPTHDLSVDAVAYFRVIFTYLQLNNNVSLEKYQEACTLEWEFWCWCSEMLVLDVDILSGDITKDLNIYHTPVLEYDIL